MSASVFPGLVFVGEVRPDTSDGAAGAGAGAGAMLDGNEQNVARGAYGRSKVSTAPRFVWGSKHFRVRAACRDFLSWGQREGHHLFFLTLTSGPGGNRDRLRKDFQALRNRLARKLGVDRSTVHYCGVDTTEGHGVLHLLVAIPKGRGRSARFMVSVEWLREAWIELRGAPQLRIVPVRSGKGDARRLSRYLVSQYLGGQDLLVRLSRSRIHSISARVRDAFRKYVFTVPERWLGWAFYGVSDIECLKRGVGWGPSYGMLRGHWWREYRKAWEQFVSSGKAMVFGVPAVLTLQGFEAL